MAPIPVTPAEAMEFLNSLLAVLAMGLFGSAQNQQALKALQSAGLQGWNNARSGEGSLKPAYLLCKQRRLGFVEKGRVSGVTKALYTFQNGSQFQVSPWGIMLMGSPMTESQLKIRKKMGGGLPGYKVGSRGGKVTSTGRFETLDNRITPALKFMINSLTPAQVAPVLSLKNANDYKSLLKSFPISYAMIKRARKGRLVYKVENNTLKYMKYTKKGGWQ